MQSLREIINGNVSKEFVIEYFKELPTTKIARLLIRQKGHPLGDWQVTKPTRKHIYVLTLI